MTKRGKTKTVITLNRFPARRAVSAASILFVFVLLPALATQAPLLQAQKSKEKPYALIAGTVWGPNDRAVPGIRVKIRRATDKPNKFESGGLFRPPRRIRPARARQRSRLHPFGRLERRKVHRRHAPPGEGSHRPHLQRRTRRHQPASSLLTGLNRTWDYCDGVTSGF